jgi:hypothetical protein
MEFLKLFAIFLLFSLAKSRPTDSDEAENCLMEYLRDRNKLDSDFTVSDSPVLYCSIAMDALVTSHKDRIRFEISQKPELKVDCLMDALNNENFVDDLILRDVIYTSNAVKEEKREGKFKVVQAKLKKTFEDAAKKCNSDPAYAGLFSLMLQTKNETMPVLIHNYCTTKFVKDSNLINLANVEENPNNIDTTNVNCNEIIENLKNERAEKVRKELKTKSISESIINCIIEKQKTANMYDITLALQVNDRSDLPITQKKSNIKAMMEKNEELSSSLFSCFFRK